MSKIVTVPEPVLRQIAKPVTKLDKRIMDIISDMETTLLTAKNPEGVGLAAPQIGYSLRIFMIRPTKNVKPIVMINPEILEFSDQLQSPDLNDGVYEGCLSIPAHYAPIERALAVKVKYQTIHSDFDIRDSKLIQKTESFSGFPAHIIQHELDHLNGVLFVDRVLEQNTKIYRVKGKTWEEVTL